MTITLDLTDKEAALFQQTLTTTLQSLVYQEAQIKDVVEGHISQTGEQLSDSAFENLLEFLKQIAPQRMLVASVLSKFMTDAHEEQNKRVTILDSRIVPAQATTKVDEKKEREAWVDSVVEDITKNF